MFNHLKEVTGNVLKSKLLGKSTPPPPPKPTKRELILLYLYLFMPLKKWTFQFHRLLQFQSLFYWCCGNEFFSNIYTFFNILQNKLYFIRVVSLKINTTQNINVFHSLFDVIKVVKLQICKLKSKWLMHKFSLGYRLFKWLHFLFTL